MAQQFRSLSLMFAPPNVTFTRPSQSLPSKVTVKSPAFDVMTDLAKVTAVTVDPNIPIDRAGEKMKHSGVRLLFVIDAGDSVLGLMTVNDLLGERPMRFQQETGVKHQDVLVRDIMTPRDKLEALALKDVQRASVGDVIETLKRAGRQHALVIEDIDGGASIRGLFSATQISRQLGLNLQASGVASTFAELEVALTHGF
jgi:CBS domain containing-hemolysin-like protein